MDEARRRIEIARKNNATALNLSHLDLTSLPPELFSLANLQILGLYNNQLTSLPPSVKNWTALQGLSLDSNQLTSLPPSVQNWTALRVLYIDSSVHLPIEVIYWRSVERIVERNQETNQWNSHVNVCEIGRFLRSRMFSLRFPQYYEKLRDYWTK